MRTDLDKFIGKRVSVLGFGRTGKAVASLMKELGANVFISEYSRSDELPDQVLSLKWVGTHRESLIVIF